MRRGNMADRNPQAMRASEETTTPRRAPPSRRASSGCAEGSTPRTAVSPHVPPAAHPLAASGRSARLWRRCLADARGAAAGWTTASGPPTGSTCATSRWSTSSPSGTTARSSTCGPTPQRDTLARTRAHAQATAQRDTRARAHAHAHARMRTYATPVCGCAAPRSC
jgi:hypothetical protein